jgi:hypothetical protein
METNNQSGFFGMWATGSKGCAAAQGRDPYRHQISTCPPSQFRISVRTPVPGGTYSLSLTHLRRGMDQLPNPTDKAAQAVVTLKDATTSTASTCMM